MISWNMQYALYKSESAILSSKSGFNEELISRNLLGKFGSLIGSSAYRSMVPILVENILLVRLIN